MAVKKVTSELDERRLINQLSPIPEWGACRAFLQTTYEFTPDFYETDYLPSILGLGAWDDRHWTSRVAMERELSTMQAVVLMDCDGYHGRPRSLRVEVLPGRGIGGRRLHAKVTLAVYDRALRLLLGSANLTEPGYRRNLEVMAALTLQPGKSDDAPLFMAAIDGWRSLLGPWLSPTGTAVLDSATEFLRNLPVPDGERDSWFCWGGGEAPVWRQVLDRWPKDDRVQRITIASPFWSEEDGRGPLMSLLREMRSRGIMDETADVALITSAKAVTETTWQPVLPDGYVTAPFADVRVTAFAQPFDPRVPAEEVQVEDFKGARDLHAKVVLLSGERTSLAYIGSANFTRRGWGFPAAGANIEAGLILLRRGRRVAELERLLPAVTGEPVQLGAGTTVGVAAPSPIDRESSWPLFLKEARLAPMSSDSARLELRLVVEGLAVHGPWTVSGVAGDDWTVRFAPETPTESLHIELTSSALEQILRDQEIRVTWWVNSAGVDYPINVDPEARDALPVNPASMGPTEAMLLSYYQGRISYEELFPPQYEVLGEVAGGDESIPSEVDTSRIQSYQVREFVESLDGLREDLKKAAGTERSMRMALLGPVSPVALGRMVRNEVRLGRRSPMAGGFELLELISCLAECRDDERAKVWAQHLKKACGELVAMLSELEAQHPELASDSFIRYRRQVFATSEELPK